MKHRVIGATEFKARCLALLDEVAESGGTITVTKRGRPVATIGPVKKKAWKSMEGILAGKIKINGDIIHTDFEYDCLRDDALI
jgi:prevent-host-death family protein